MWYDFYNLWSENGVGPILTALEPTRGNDAKYSCLPERLLFQPIAFETLSLLALSGFIFSVNWVSGWVRRLEMFAKELSCFRDCLLSSNITTQFSSMSPLVISTLSWTSRDSSNLFRDHTDLWPFNLTFLALWFLTPWAIWNNNNNNNNVDISMPS